VAGLLSWGAPATPFCFKGEAFTFVLEIRGRIAGGSGFVELRDVKTRAARRSNPQNPLEFSGGCVYRLIDYPDSPETGKRRDAEP
jgi:hypothetical protein